MFRIHLARFMALGAALLVIGCNSSGGGLCNTCGDRPGLFSRFRTTSTTQPVMVGGECCDRTVTGPILPPMGQPGSTLPAPQPNTNIPRADENGKQMPWDPKMSGRPGVKTGNDNRFLKEGY